MTRAFVLFLSLLLSLAAFGQQPSSFVKLTLPEPERPTIDSTVRLFAVLSNESAGTDVADVTVEIGVAGGPYVGGESNDRWTCANYQSPYRVRCTTAILRAGESLPVQIYIGPASEGTFEVSGSAFYFIAEERFFTFAFSRSVRFPRALFVTNTNDAGEGSLRAAVEDLNGVCSRNRLPCDVSFRIPEDGPHTIVLETPLPPITAPNFRIDGPADAEVVVDGAKLHGGHGLELLGMGPYAVTRLTLRGFPWDGIAVARTTPLGHAFITGNTLARNGSRGLTFNPPSGDAEVAGNAIVDNARSGIFLTGVSGMTFTANRIEGNGASGIYIGPCWSSRVTGNRIAGNAQYGIALDRRANLVRLYENSIAGNGLPGIDRGLDGFNGYDYDDYDLNNAKIPPPRLTSATYDPATDTTTITGTYFDPVDYWGSWTISVYRNDVPGAHGDVLLGHPVVSGGAFTMTVPGDLRGEYITADGGRYLNLGWSGEWAWPSEFSDWVQVQ